MKCYYAHPLTLYNTEQDRRDIETLEGLGFNVLNPNAPEHEAAYHMHGMEHFKDLVRSCDCLAFRSFPDGSIPAGVAGEIQEMRTYGMPVFELPTAVIGRTLSVDRTREVFREAGYR